jgi:outer membrane murein-binding lipoprotein Lpp
MTADRHQCIFKGACSDPRLASLPPRPEPLPQADEVFWASRCLVGRPAASIHSVHRQRGRRKEAKMDQTTTQQRWTAAQLRKLPPKERDAIMEAAAAAAEQEHRTNRELTAFEAFGKDDLYGESSSTETR